MILHSGGSLRVLARLDFQRVATNWTRRAEKLRSDALFRKPTCHKHDVYFELNRVPAPALYLPIIALRDTLAIYFAL